MTQDEILEYNKLCAEFLGVDVNYSTEVYKDSKSTLRQYIHNMPKSESLKFHSDWNWIMEVINKIFAIGFRKYSYTHEEHSRCVFTDMAISYQKHEFGGGNVIADSDKCSEEKEAVVKAINQFLIWYKQQKQ